MVLVTLAKEGWRPSIHQREKSKYKQYQVLPTECHDHPHALAHGGIRHFGGISSPYIWLKTPQEYPSSWDFFNYLLTEKQIIGTPGVGFGKEGEGYFRLSAFSTHEATAEAMQRLTK